MPPKKDPTARNCCTTALSSNGVVHKQCKKAHKETLECRCEENPGHQGLEQERLEKGMSQRVYMLKGSLTGEKAVLVASLTPSAQVGRLFTHAVREPMTTQETSESFVSNLSYAFRSCAKTKPTLGGDDLTVAPVRSWLLSGVSPGSAMVVMHRP
eukprot:1191483-Prorocentrum_minimum.AAC.4